MKRSLAVYVILSSLISTHTFANDDVNELHNSKKNG